MITFKKGNATVTVHENNGMVYKQLKTQSKFNRELEAYKLLEKCEFVPELLSTNESHCILVTKYVGQSLNLKYNPKDRYKFKSEIRKMNEILITCFGVHHNDIRWKNVVEDDNGKLWLIDFEMWTPVSVGSRERDPEKILI